PQMPEDWNFMKLKNVHGFQKEFDITVLRENDKIRVTVKSGNTDVFSKLVQNGSSQTIKF
ncbi:MAG: hypothetical protein WAT34_09015, partial [Chitinophagaceae bacterium]